MAFQAARRTLALWSLVSWRFLRLNSKLFSFIVGLLCFSGSSKFIERKSFIVVGTSKVGVKAKGFDIPPHTGCRI